ncbi:MAG: CDP-diacylglycerol--glycerol-3-phosphate 3-phosphatidyltransferase, partial [Pseudomonadota bacterium]
MTTANAITIGRILLVVPFVIAFLANTSWNLTIALAIFVAAALSDFLDGWIARKKGEVTAIGAALDPIADKLIVAAALILLVKNGVIRGIDVLPMLVIVLREVLISGLREAVSKGLGDLPVTRLSKWKTTMQLIACGALLAVAPSGLLGPAGPLKYQQSPDLPALASFTLWIAALLSAVTGAKYIGAVIQMMVQQPKTK